MEARGFVLEISADEAACGFARHDRFAIPVVVCRLLGGLVAVKRRLDDGAIVYEICDASLSPIYSAASSLDELKQRFQPLQA